MIKNDKLGTVIGSLQAILRNRRMAKEILIADSDKTDQKEFQRIFQSTDYHLIFSESGEDALLRAKLFKPDMIIASGGGLQEKGGLELCGAVKGDPDFEHIPFILISSIFDEISESDRKRIRADGVISKPLNEVEVLDLVGNLMEEGTDGKRGEMVSEKQDFPLDETADEEEEIIELVDVVGEPEPRMSIDSFVPTGREKAFGEVPSLDSWEKPEFVEKPVEKELEPHPEKKSAGMDLRLKRKVPLREASPEEELFDKIELEEILEKVEQLKPSLEKEWPAGKEVRDIEESPFQMEEPAEKLDLSEFEKALRREVKTAPPQEEPQSFLVEEPKKEVTEETLFSEELLEEPSEKPTQKPIEKVSREPLEESIGEAVEEASGATVAEVAEEAFEEVLEEPLVEVEPLEESPAKPLKESVEESLREALGEPVEEVSEESVEIEEIKELAEEEFPEELLEDLLGEEEVGAVEEPKGVDAEELSLEELDIEPLEGIGEIEKLDEAEEVEEIGGTEPTDQIEEMEQLEEVEEITRIDRLEEVAAPSMIRAEAAKAAQSEATKIRQEQVPPPVSALDRQMHEIISKKVQEIMGEMMTKLVPEMTQNVVSFTIERIEKIVKEVVPDLAEKAIQEEIKRLEKGEKG